MTAQRVALHVVERAARTAQALQRAAMALQTFTSAVADSILDSPSKRVLTARAYDRQASRAHSLFAWEEAWLARDLPSPPARVLLGGCGRGREVGPLLARGYEIWAFDPSLRSVQDCQRSWPGLQFVGWFGYEQLVQSFRSSDRQLLPPEMRFDAVLLGWSSLSHVIEEADQEALLCLLGTLVPHGPILASFWLADVSGRAATRAARFGVATARLLGGRHRALRHRVAFDARSGFGYTFDRPRLHALAAAAGRSVTIDAESFPHATFHPPASAASAFA